MGTSQKNPQTLISGMESSLCWHGSACTCLGCLQVIPYIVGKNEHLFHIYSTGES